MTRSPLTDAVSAVEIVPPTHYRWLGVSSPPLRAEFRRRLSTEEAREYLLLTIERRLYDAWYCPGRPVAITGREHGPSHGSAEFVAKLSEANCGAGCWESGWSARACADHALELSRNGLALLAGAGEWRAGAAGDLELRVPKELLRLSPGYYMAVLNRPLPEPGLILRLYWNLRARGAVPFVRAATRYGNRAGIPGRMKVVNDPGRFDRADAAVLYVAAKNLDAAGELARAVHRAVETHLNPRVPGFTKELAPGVAVAEDPGGARSFGQDRCRLLAEGVVRAHELGRRQLADRVAVVREVMIERGIDPDAPYRRALDLGGWNPLT